MPPRKRPEYHRSLERSRQVRGLLLIAVAVLAFAIFRAGIHNVFTHGWWRLW